MQPFPAGASFDSARYSGAAKRQREKQTKLRPLSGLTLNGNRSAVVLHYPVDYSQTHSCPFISWFGREEGIENPLQCLFVHAMACIAHFQAEIRSRSKLKWERAVEFAKFHLREFHFQNSSVLAHGCAALAHRFIITWCIWVGSAMTM